MLPELNFKKDAATPSIVTEVTESKFHPRIVTGLVSITLETGTVTYPGQWDALVKA